MKPAQILSLLSHISFVAAIIYRLKFRDNNPWEFAIALFAYAILFAFYPQSLLNDNKKTIAMLFFYGVFDRDRVAAPANRRDRLRRESTGDPLLITAARASDTIFKIYCKIRALIY